MKQDIEVASRIEREKVTQELHEFAVPLFKAGAEWRINSVKMLKEILSFVRKVDSAEYRDHQDFMEFLRNVAADIWVEYTEPEQRSKLFNLINKEK